MLRPLVEECLDDDPAVRPTMATVCERIQMSNMKESPQEYITLCKKVEQQEIENNELRNEIEQLKRENEQQRTKAEQMVINSNYYI